MILDGKQDKSFLVFYEEWFSLFLQLCMFFDLFRGFVDDVFLANDSGGVLFSSTCTGEILLHSRDREIGVLAEVQFWKSNCGLNKNTLISSNSDANERINNDTFFDGVRSTDAIDNWQLGRFCCIKGNDSACFEEMFLSSLTRRCDDDDDVVVSHVRKMGGSSVVL